MPTYTVKAAAKKKDVPDAKFGPAQVIALTLSNGDGEKEAEWFTKATTALPEPGQMLEGDVTKGTYGLQFKKAQSGGGGFSRSPRDSARIERQHSQEMAIRVIALMAANFSEEQMEGWLRRWTDWFVADLDNASAEDRRPGTNSVEQGRTVSRDNASPTTATGFASPKAKTFFERLLKEAGGKPETVNAIVLYAENGLARNLVSEAIDGLKDEATRRATALVLAQDANEWAAKQPSDIPHDDTAAPETEAMADDPSVKF